MGDAPTRGTAANARDAGNSQSAIAGLQSARALRRNNARCEAFQDRVIEETPVAMLYNGVAHAVMMATPCDLEDFALGFTLTEAIIEQAKEFELVECLRSKHGISLQALIPHARFAALESRPRNLAGRSGCGLCGVASLEAAVRPLQPVLSSICVTMSMVNRGLRELSERQPLNLASGGAHAAGYVHANGILVREDVGRHNALDKVIGALARGGSSGDANAHGASAAWREGAGLLAITSRASYEIVHKAASAGIAVIAAISAPTSLAIRLAQEAGVTLIGFARDAGMNVYTHTDRIE